MTAVHLPAIRDVFAVEKPYWFRLAACRGQDPAIFFPERGHDRGTTAREFCDRCPVAVQCRSFAVEANIPDGVFGGTTPRDRRRLRRDMRESA